MGLIPPNSAVVGIDISNGNQTWSFLVDELKQMERSSTISLPIVENSTPNSVWEFAPN